MRGASPVAGLALDVPEEGRVPPVFGYPCDLHAARVAPEAGLVGALMGLFQTGEGVGMVRAEPEIVLGRMASAAALSPAEAGLPLQETLPGVAGERLGGSLQIG